MSDYTAAPISTADHPRSGDAFVSSVLPSQAHAQDFLCSQYFVIKECLKEFRYCASGLGSSKIVNFCRTEAGLTSKWGRISQAVYWWHQNRSSYIV